MGKSQKKRAVRRHNPVRVPDSHLPKGLDAAAATSSKKGAVLPIIQKLESVDAQERTWACSAVSNLIQNDPSTRRLLQGKNIVGVLINRLSDSVEEVVVEAAGALRNLCIDGGYEICAEMYNKNILATLKTFIPKISNALHQLVTSPKSAPDNTTELVFGLAENVITLLWCLSETSNKALNAINEIHLAPFLMAFLENRDKLPSRTVAAAAQCLYVLTDDNSPAIEALRSNSSYTACLLLAASSAAPQAHEPPEAEERIVSIKILSAGILRNISPVPAPSTASAVDIDRSVILPLITPFLTSISLSESSSRVIELVSKEQEDPVVEKPSLKHTPKSDHKSPSEREIERIEARLRNVQLSLEILTGVCATLPDPEPVSEEEEDTEDAEDDEDLEGGNDDDIEMETDEVIDESNVNGPKAQNPTSPSLLPSILTPLITLIQPVSLSFPPLQTGSATAVPPPTHLPTTSALSAIHISALECLNNVFLALALSGESATESAKADLEGGKRVWDALWTSLEQVGLEGGRGQEKRKEMWEISVGVMWGIGVIWKGSLPPNEEQVKLLMQLCDGSTDEQVKVKCIGALESLAQYPDSTEANRIIAAYLLSIASSPSPIPSPEPVLQAASALIDIYSDENMPYDINFRQGGFLQALVISVENVRRAVRSIDRKREGGRALRLRGDEILENLRAFVKYRRDLKL